MLWSFPVLEVGTLTITWEIGSIFHHPRVVKEEYFGTPVRIRVASGAKFSCRNAYMLHLTFPSARSLWATYLPKPSSELFTSLGKRLQVSLSNGDIKRNCIFYWILLCELVDQGSHTAFALWLIGKIYSVLLSYEGKHSNPWRAEPASRWESS